MSLGHSLTLDHTHQVVGRVQAGKEVLEMLNDVGTLTDDSPAQRVSISRCGATTSQVGEGGFSLVWGGGRGDRVLGWGGGDHWHAGGLFCALPPAPRPPSLLTHPLPSHLPSHLPLPSSPSQGIHDSLEAAGPSGKAVDPATRLANESTLARASVM